MPKSRRGTKTMSRTEEQLRLSLLRENIITELRESIYPYMSSSDFNYFKKYRIGRTVDEILQLFADSAREFQK